MSDKVIKQSDKVINSGLFDIHNEDFGFNSALLIKPASQSIDHQGQDNLAGQGNLNLCTDSHLSESKKKSIDSKISEMNFKNCISSDLLKRLEESSPIKSNKTLKSDRSDLYYMTNYTDRNENELEDEEEFTGNHKNMNKDSHSLFYGRNNPTNDMEKLYLMEHNMEYDDENIPIDNLAENFFKNSRVSEGFSVISKDNLKIPTSMSLPAYGSTTKMENGFPEQNPNFVNPYQKYFRMDSIKENIGNFIKNDPLLKKSGRDNQNLHQRYGFPDEDKTFSEKSPDFKRFYHLNNDIAFYPKNYNPGHSVTPTSNNSRFTELNDQNNSKKIHLNPFNNSSFSKGVNNLFNNKINVLHNNQNFDETKFNSLIFTENNRKGETVSHPTKISQKQIQNKVSVSTIDKNNPSKNYAFPANNRKVSYNNQTTEVNHISNPIHSDIKLQIISKENNDSDKHDHNVNLKSYMHGKSGWICKNCKNFNYETRIKCNRCAHPQIKNITLDKEKITNNNAQENSVSSSASKQAAINNNCSNKSNFIYNKNPKYASNHHKNLLYGSNAKENHNKKPSLIEINKTESFNEITEHTKNLTSSEIPTKANSTDSKKKKKPFVERVGDWVCIKCKNLNFSFRVVCNRCQLTKAESENLIEQYMKNLMNYVKLNEILQNQIFSSSNINNLLELNGINNQLMINLNKTLQQQKLEIPNETHLLNYLKNKCLNSNGLSPKTNLSTEGNNSNLGICENYFTEDSSCDKLGNKSK